MFDEISIITASADEATGDEDGAELGDWVRELLEGLSAGVETGDVPQEVTSRRIRSSRVRIAPSNDPRVNQLQDAPLSGREPEQGPTRR